jgi:hypothetical protein
MHGFLLEHNHVGFHEETANRVSDTGALKLWVWDCFMLLFLREGTQSQSSRDDTRARGLTPNIMYMGGNVTMTGGKEDH